MDEPNATITEALTNWWDCRAELDRVKAWGGQPDDALLRELAVAETDLQAALTDR